MEDSVRSTNSTDTASLIDNLGLIDRKEATALLLQARTSATGLLNDFEMSEIGGLADNMDFIPFEKGLALIQKGERASWVGIILQGSIDVYVTDVATSKPVATLKNGIWIGEMSVFEGGSRNAHCVAASRGVIAPISFAELQALGESEPELAAKLYKE